jgi:hypothetical protein
VEFGHALDPMRPGERRRLRVGFRNLLVSDTYYVGALVCSRTAPGNVFAVRNRAARFGVIGGEHVGGVYEIERDLDLARVQAEARA